jgi:hypothetical protein
MIPILFFPPQIQLPAGSPFFSLVHTYAVELADGGHLALATSFLELVVGLAACPDSS